MYHHRYQPQTPHLANRTSSAFANNGHSNIGNVNASPSSASLRSSNSVPHQDVAPPSNNFVSSSTVLSNLASNPSAVGNLHIGGNYRNSGTSNTYSSPFSALPKQFVEERQDVIFRRVRGILNKITPETFDKLTNELVNVGLDSPRTLRGVIYLLFDKALKDLKYSSLYAKLCQELSEKSPNFEVDPGPNTFCKFLISKCEDEFERRRKATEDFDGKDELTDDEFEQRIIVKQKMLGNIKFICELGKKRLLQEEILHECIRGLLSRKKKERSLQDQAQDLECLCQIMRTIGSLLDVDASRNLMNQYFERIEMFSKKTDLPSRIRFMLKDVIDLRNNDWRPRPFQREDNVPQPLSKLREELGLSSGSPSVPMDKLGNKNLMNIGDLSKLSGSKLNSFLIDDGPSLTTTTDFHWGSPFIADDSAYDIFSNTMPTTKVGQRIDPTASNELIVKSDSISKSANNNPIDIFNRKPYDESRLDPFNDYRFPDANNRIDPFSDSFKAKMSPSNNLGNNIDRRPVRVEQSTHQSKRNDAHRSDFQGAQLSTTRDPIGPGSRMRFDRSDENRSAGIGERFGKENEIPNLQSRVNNAPYNHHQHQSSMYPLNHNEHQPPNQPTRNFAYTDSPRPIPSRQNRSCHVSGNMQHTSTRYNSSDLMPPPALPKKTAVDQTRPISPYQQQHPRARSNQSDQPLVPTAEYQLNRQQNSVQRQHYRQVGIDRLPTSQERHFDNRAGFTERREQRQPKFSGANYRLPGRDRRLMPAPSNNRDRVLDSDRSQDWRADSVAAPARKSDPASTDRNPTKDTDDTGPRQSEPSVRHRNQPDCSNKRHDDELSGESQIRPNQVARMSNQDRRAQKDSNFVEASQLHHDHDSYSDQKDEEQRQSDQKGDKSEIVTGDSKILDNNSGENRQLDRSTGPRRFPGEIQPAAIHPPSFQTRRPHNQERMRRENPRRPIVEFDGRVFQRPFQNDTSSLERKHPKQTMPRNQSFGGTTPNNDSKSTPIRRIKDNTVNNSTPSVMKDSITNTIPNSLLTKSSLRTIDSDFSLRPSHNLTSQKKVFPVAQVASGQTQINQAEVINNIQTLTEAKLDLVDEHDTDHPLNSSLKPSQRLTEKIILNARVNASVDFSRATLKYDASSKRVKSEPLVDQFITIFSEVYEEDVDLSKLIVRLKELRLPRSLQPECLIKIMEDIMMSSDRDRDDACKILAQIAPSMFDVSGFTDALKTIFERLQAMEVETPKVKSLVAGMLGKITTYGPLTVGDIADMLVGGKHHPLFLLFLQKLDSYNGKAWLSEKFLDSKVVLMDMLPEVDRTNDRLASALKGRCLGFLDPMLTIEPDLWEQMTDQDPSPGAIYRWIKENVDQGIQSTTTFAFVFVRCLSRYIHETCMKRIQSSGIAASCIDSGSSNSISELGKSNKSSPSNSAAQASIDQEKELLSKYQHILQAILKDRPMQLASLYALQSFYHSLDFPKGALLRWFHLLYDMSIVDDDVYFIWKEEINDKYPGKGQALFQVNTWLQWLAEAESEEEEEDGD